MSLIRFGRAREYQFLRREDVRTRWDLKSATHFLNSFRNDAVAFGALRREASAFGGLSSKGNLSDDQVIQILARQLVAGELLVALPHRLKQFDHLEKANPDTPSAPREARVVEQVEDPNTFDSAHDGVAQAAVLIAAAQAGVPFCEECQKETEAAAAR